ncbi:MAG: VOC family protein [Rubrobacter sp.]|nr:VOC family protein [Rubrobacter sp.]
MITGLDHLVILVRDLDCAARDYERLGFAVTPGGEHADGLTRNALVPFQDGSYLELVAFVNPDDSQDNVWGWRRFVATGGLVDHCLASDDLVSDARRLREAGFEVSGPADGGRRLPDGQEIRWRSASVAQEGRALPFLIEDLTPRPRRVPAGRAAIHPNGATGISALEIAAPDPENAAPDPENAARSYATLAGGPAPKEGGETMRLGSRAVSFAGPEDEDSQRRLDAIGSGPLAMELASGEGGKRSLDLDLAHGARIRIG